MIEVKSENQHKVAVYNGAAVRRLRISVVLEDGRGEVVVLQ